jgi:glycosyltransferase involved in cell wall biosynthesis
MRILYFSRAYTTHDRRFLAALAASPHEIWYLRLESDAVSYETRPVPDTVQSMEPLSGGESISTPERYFRLVPRFEAALDRVRPDLVHAGPVQSCALIAALAGFRPLLAMSWGSDLLVDADRDAFWNWMTRFALGHADRLLTDCEEVSQAAQRIAGLARKNIVQFPWGVDTAAFRPGADRLALRRMLGWEDCLVVISTRSWEPIYGVLQLLEGFRLAHRQDPRLRLVLAGDGSQRPEVERLISTGGLLHAVWLLGAVPHDALPDYFRAADLYASFAASDGSSISLLEAMATGLPVIATDRASNREWIADPSSGFLVPFGDTGAMAAACLDIANLPASRRREMGASNRAIAESRANWERNIGMLLAAYQSLAPQTEEVTI